MTLRHVRTVTLTLGEPMRAPRIVAGATTAFLVLGLLVAAPSAASTPSVTIDTAATATNSTGDVVLAWKAIPGATSYKVEIADDSSFSSANIVDFATTSALRWVPTTGLWGSTDERELFWRVVPNGVGASGSDAQVHRFSRVAAPSPVQTTPAADAIVDYPAPVTFTWQPVPGAQDYTLTYWTSNGSPIEVRGLTTTSRAPAEPLGAGTWQWNVRASFRSSGASLATFAGPTSTTRTFTTRWTDAASTPTLIKPADGAVLNDVELAWSQVPGASKYLLELSLDDEFTKVSLTSEVSGTAFSLTRPLPSTTYFWRVRAFDAQGNAASKHSATRQLRKIMGASADSVPAPGSETTRPVLTVGSTDLAAPVSIPHDTFAITWEPVPRASFYEVVVTQLGGGDPVTCKTASTTATILADYVSTGNQTAAHYSGGSCLWSTDARRAIMPGKLYSVTVTAVNVAADSAAAYQTTDADNAAVVPSAKSDEHFFVVSEGGRPTLNDVVPDQIGLVSTDAVSPTFSWSPLSYTPDGGAGPSRAGYMVELYTDSTKSSQIGTYWTPTPVFTPNGIFARNTTTASSDAYFAVITPMTSGLVDRSAWARLVGPATGSVSWKRTGESPAAGTVADVGGQKLLRMTPTPKSALGGASRGYRVLIHQKGSSDTFATLNVDQPSTLAAKQIAYSASNVGLTSLPAGAYEFRYAILDGAGQPGPYSARTGFTIGYQTVTAMSETVLPGATGTVLTWEPTVSAASYEVSVTPQGGTAKKIPTEQTSIVVTDQTPGVTYSWSVTSLDKDKNRSEASSLRTYVAPVGKVTTSGATSSPASTVRLTWTPVTGASRYLVRLREAGSSSTVEVAETAATSWTPTKSLAYGKAYSWDVRAVPEKYFTVSSTTRPVVAVSPDATLTVTTAPGTPSGLRLASGPASVTASWTALAGVARGSSVAPGYVLRYGVARADGLDPAWTTVVVGSGTSKKLSGLRPGTTYVAQVAAANAQGQSAWSRSVTAKTADSGPSAPRLVKATRGDRSAKVVWTAPTSAGTSGITGYLVQTRTYSSGAWSAWRSTRAAAAARSVTVSNLTNSLKTEVRVLATSRAGNSPASASAIVTPAGKPLAPSGVKASSTKKKTVKITWKAASANGSKVTGYVVQYSTNGKSWKTPKSTTAKSYTWKKAKSKKTYHFRVYAKNALGSGAKSSSARVVVK